VETFKESLSNKCSWISFRLSKSVKMFLFNDDVLFVGCYCMISSQISLVKLREVLLFLHYSSPCYKLVYDILIL